MFNDKGPNKNPIGSSYRVKLISLSFFLFFLFFLLIIQFYKVQIIEGKKWTKTAESQHCFLVKEPFMRGSFYSNTSLKTNHPCEPQPLVMDIPKFHLFIDPDSIPEAHKDQIITNLIKYAPKTSDQAQKLKEHFYKKSRSRKIITWLDTDKKKHIESWWLAFARSKKIAKNALFFVRDYQRSYPFGHLLGPVLHTIQDEKDNKSLQGIPTGGLETYCNKYLQGKIGKRLVLRSLRHSLDTIKVIDEPQNGADVYLTINHYIQAIVEEELEKGVKEVNGKGGWAVMMDPSTGEIWALAQYPFFNPAAYRQYFNDKEKMEHTRVKAVMDSFQPGSIFKPITLAICMRANEELIMKNQPPLFDPSEKIKTSNGNFPGRGKKPVKDGRLHYFLNMYHAVQKSSNIYMGRVVDRLIKRMGENWYKRALEDLFGFGKRTGIELPAEIPGLVPTPGKLHPNGKLEWSLPTPYALACGHNILVNSVQMARAHAILANRGLDVKPHLIKKISRRELDGRETILIETKLPSVPVRLISQENAEKLIQAMKYTTKLGGTSFAGDIPGYTEAGKSGSSEKIINGQYSHSHYISSFVGSAPASHPRFVLIVTVDEPEMKFIPGKGKLYLGGVCASPIFKRIGERTLQYLGVAPDDPHGYPYGDKRRNVSQADWIKETKMLKEIYDKWNSVR